MSEAEKEIMDKTFTDSIQDRVEGYLDAIESTAGTAGEFVVEQTPLVAQEYLAWVFWGSVFWASLMGVVILGIAIVFRKLFAWAWAFDGSDDRTSIDPPATVFVVGGAVIILSLPVIAFVCSTLEAIRVTVAPLRS